MNITWLEIALTAFCTAYTTYKAVWITFFIEAWMKEEMAWTTKKLGPPPPGFEAELREFRVGYARRIRYATVFSWVMFIIVLIAASVPR